MKVLKKTLILVFLFVSLFLLISCNEEEKEKNNNNQKEPNTDIDVDTLPAVKDEYKVQLHNNKTEYGDDDMHDFYLLTSGGNKLSIRITRVYDKDYLNSVKAQSDPEVTEGRTDVYDLEYDGEKYIYYKVENNNQSEETRTIIKSYPYLNYSEKGNYEGYAEYTKRVSYVIADSPTITFEMWMNESLSSSHLSNIVSRATPIINFYYYGNLLFRWDKIMNIGYTDDNGIKSYYTNSKTLKTVVDILNNLEWSKNPDDFGNYDEEIKTSKENITIHMIRQLISDKKGLILPISDENGDYLLYYSFHLASGYVTMGYASLSSVNNNIYAKLSQNQITKLRSIIDEKLEKDFTVGKYQCFLSDTSGIMTVEIVDDSLANIYCDSFSGSSTSTNVTTGERQVVTVAKGTYTIDRSKQILEIVDGKYKYRFKLSIKGNKGICYVEEGSNCNSDFKISDGTTLYYEYLLSLSSSYATVHPYYKLAFVCNLGTPNENISSAMQEYAKDVKTGYEDAILYNVTPDALMGICNVYKYDKSCQTFLEYNGNIYQIGFSFGGYGVTQFAYYYTVEKTLLYFIFSYGSGIHRTNVWAFDLIECKQMSVDCELNGKDSMMIDAEFVMNRKETGELELSIVQAKFHWSNHYFNYTSEQGDVITRDLLKCDLKEMDNN
ncbi:MAG: hypothetical protein J5666_09300 [Bacilli bacterium]|nr:hypothetical protein [Bacilli bacterium]